MRRILALLLVSAAIFEARAEAMFFIVAAAVAGALVSGRLPGRAMLPLRPLRLLAFVPYFALQSARGGIDVAVRALRWPYTLRPGFLTYDVRIEHPVLRVIFANAVSLMPGTFTAHLEGNRLTVHALDTKAGLTPRLVELERRLSHAFGEDRA
jgi:multicomponent Na+:H+ antiporter subunit E